MVTGSTTSVLLAFAVRTPRFLEQFSCPGCSRVLVRCAAGSARNSKPPSCILETCLRVSFQRIHDIEARAATLWLTK